MAPLLRRKGKAKMATRPDREELVIEWRESVLKVSDNVKRLAECTGGKRDGFLDQFHLTDQAASTAKTFTLR